jgi:hypothetical protein
MNRLDIQALYQYLVHGMIPLLAVLLDRCPLARHGPGAVEEGSPTNGEST